MNATVSVVIPNLHSPVIGDVLDAVLAQADAGAEPLDVWVVGLDRHGLVRPSDRVHTVTTQQPVPPARARNMGSAAAEGQTLIFLDADCIPEPGWLRAMLEAAARWPDAGAISGAMLPHGDSCVAQCGQIAGFNEHLTLQSAGKRRILASFSLLVPRGTWDAVDGFDEQLRTAEDIDFSIRTALSGRPLYFEPRAAVLHRHQRSTWRSLWSHDFRSGSNSIRVRHRHFPYYRMPEALFRPWVWLLLSPGIAAARTIQLYSRCPALMRYIQCLPWVTVSKLAWCWGAAAGLRNARGQATAKRSR